MKSSGHTEANELRKRSESHLSRKLFHILSGTAIMLLFVNTFTRIEAIVLMLAGGFLFAMVDLLRLKVASLNELALKWMGPLMREGEHKSVSAQLYYILGLTWCIAAPPKPVAVQAILTLAWMDPIAALFGVRFGRTPWNSVFRTSVSLGGKTVEGSFAGFLAAFLAGIVAWTGTWTAVPAEGRLWWPDPWIVLLMSSVGGLGALVAEAWPSQWDDNVNIPFWTSLVVWAAVAALGVPVNYF